MPYPGWDGVGTCDHTLSRKYGRMAIGSEDPCDQYVPVKGAPAGRPESRSPSFRRSTCEDCHYWLPFELMPQVGQCDNPTSRHFRSPEFSDKPTEGCFVTRSLDGLEFMWCQSHRQTIYSKELPDHRSCHVFVSSVSLPVEDEMELTLAGD
jgi:hypothetical protein